MTFPHTTARFRHGRPIPADEPSAPPPGSPAPPDALPLPFLPLDREWLPEGEWEELTELREEHHRLLDAYDAARARPAELRAQFVEEDRRRRERLAQAYSEGRDPDRIKRGTPEAERAAKLDHAQEHVEAAERALRAFPRKVAEVLRDLWDDLEADLDEQREEADAEVTEAERALRIAQTKAKFAQSERRRIDQLREWLVKTRDGSVVSRERRPITLPPEESLADIANRNVVAAPNPGWYPEATLPPGHRELHPGEARAHGYESPEEDETDA